jgi:hypothetical protein
MKSLSPKYYDLYRNIKYFFIENRSNMDVDVIEENKHLFINGS